jgi:hypothetical protein
MMDWQLLQCEPYYSHVHSVLRIGEPHMSTGRSPIRCRPVSSPEPLLVLTVLQLAKSASLHDDIREIAS